MKLAINAIKLLQHHSGLGTYTRELLRAMPLDEADIFAYAARAERFDEGPRLERVNTSGREPKALHFVAQKLFLPRRVRKDGADAFLALTPLHALLRPPVPQVTVVHDLTPIVVPSAGPKLRWVFRLLMPRLLRASNRIIAVSEATRRDLVQRFNVDEDRVHVIHEGYNTDQFHPSVTPLDAEFVGADRYLLYVGDQSPHKNIAGTLRAFAKSVARRNGVALAIGGLKDPRFYPSMEALARSLGIADDVRWLGYISDEDLPRLIAGATAFVFPSLYEGFGLPVLEAMACGTPVITSNTSSIPEVAGDAALLVDPTNTDQLAAAIDRIATDDALRHDLAQRGPQRAARFSWAKCARETLDVCRLAAGE